MQIHASNDFAAAPDAVFAMLTDRVFLRANALATDPLEHEVSVNGLTTTTRRVMPSPSAVARFTGSTLAIIDEIRWEPENGPVRTGAASITVEGMPAGLVGTVRLSPGGRGTLLDYDGELTVNVPILGPSLAKQAAPVLLDALATQQQVGDAYLATALAE
ncbi:MAG: hypothetical protein CVT62_01870 [Actinobacteria bacterium HGW-Actinobacteria-2]|nr:MAG: hypothetical protein CVT62_01870 [Actinobacteria bacterium HGW-Actinobacteria-2]